MCQRSGDFHVTTCRRAQHTSKCKNACWSGKATRILVACLASARSVMTKRDQYETFRSSLHTTRARPLTRTIQNGGLWLCSVPTLVSEELDFLCICVNVDKQRQLISDSDAKSYCVLWRCVLFGVFGVFGRVTPNRKISSSRRGINPPIIHMVEFTPCLGPTLPNCAFTCCAFHVHTFMIMILLSMPWL
jgi:hypothetical protein